MMNLTRDELSAIAQAIQSAWNAGSIREPQAALFLLSGSDKLRQEWERLGEPRVHPQDHGVGLPLLYVETSFGIKYVEKPIGKRVAKLVAK